MLTAFFLLAIYEKIKSRYGRAGETVDDNMAKES
jgi:hypothetical protein